MFCCLFLILYHLIFLVSIGDELYEVQLPKYLYGNIPCHVVWISSRKYWESSGRTLTKSVGFIFSGAPLLLTRDYTTLAEALLIFLGVEEDWTTQSFFSVQPIKKPGFTNLHFVQVLPVVGQAYLTNLTQASFHN